jgi:predicted unusual protein kinase regulating ubiquinone biosynthesis (AarF/ABC1/UbiB family)
MARERHDIPTGRVRRASKVGRLAATQTAKQMGTRAANVGRGDEGKQRALERRQIETAEQIVAALGTMKGAAMKLGQVMSFLDVGLVPEDYREEFQAKLAALRDAAPKVSFKDMRKVIEQDLGGKLSEFFEDFDEDAIAAASIGQVYRARTVEGRDVAVKVQYPGVNRAVRSDMQNLGLIMRLMQRMAPGLDSKGLAEEIRERIGEELDYELEAANQRRLARIYRGHPFVIIPDVLSDLSGERVMVSEYVEGRGFDDAKADPDVDRDRFGEIIFRFYYGCMYRHRQFSGDPHPGNCRLLADERVAFLDFGLFKTISSDVADVELASQRMAVEGRWEELIEMWGRTGFLNEPERMAPERLQAYIEDIAWWYMADEEITLTPEIASSVLMELTDPRGKHFARMRHESLPPDHLFGRRLEILTLAVLGQLRPTHNWHRIAREWMYGDAPVTELGRAEAEFFSRAAA